MNVDDEQAKQLIKEFIGLKAVVDDAYDQMRALTGMSPESPLGRVIYQTLDAYLQTLQRLIDPDNDWLDWFVWENDCGKQGLSAGYGDKMTPINSLDDLIELMKTAQP